MLRTPVLFSVLALALAATSGEAQVGTRWIFPVVVHVGEDASGSALIDGSGVAAIVADANRAFQPAGVCFATIGVRPLAGVSELANIRARRALGRLTEDGAIHVFLVASIRDPHPSSSTVRASAAVGRVPSGWLGGAHIPRRRGFPDTYVVATAGSATRARTVAHELGHVMGAVHSADPANLMSYGTERVGFSEDQLTAFARRARRLARRRWLPTPAADCP